MIDLALDPTTGDLLITDFDLSIVTGVNQVAQNLAIRLRFFLAEWYLDLTAGVPYYQYFLVKAPNQIQIESFLKEEIANTRGVSEITEFSSSFNPDVRSYNVNFSVIALNDTLQIQMEIP